MMMADPILRIENLSKRYGKKDVLKGASLDVNKGDLKILIGPSGAGKSTLLQILCGTLAPTTGTYQTHGRISSLLELGSGFNPEFTGSDNV